MNTNFEYKFAYKGVFFRYAKGRSVKEGNEIHTYHEIIYFINGGGKCLTEHFDTQLKTKTLFIIPKNTYHRFAINDQENYTRVTIAFDGVDELNKMALLSQNQVKTFDLSDKELNFLLGKIIAVLSENENKPQKNIALYGSFLLLLTRLFESEDKASAQKKSEDRQLISKCTEYIDGHFSEDLSVETLAEKMNVSVATLFWHFKRYLGISVYKYVLQKRMIHAHDLLRQGKMPTKIYMECGFNDYATFYKVFVKRFGCAPSKMMTSNNKGDKYESAVSDPCDSI